MASLQQFLQGRSEAERGGPASFVKKAELAGEDCTLAGIEGMSAICQLLLAHGSVCTLPFRIT